MNLNKIFNPFTVKKLQKEAEVEIQNNFDKLSDDEVKQYCIYGYMFLKFLQMLKMNV